MTKKRRPYTGVLAQPMYLDELTPKAIEERSLALLKHYDIDASKTAFPMAMMRLGYALAQEWVPGFRIKRRSGRPQSPNGMLAGAVVEDFAARMGLGEDAAIRAAAEYLGRDAKSVGRAYRAAMKARAIKLNEEAAIARNREAARDDAEAMRE